MTTFEALILGLIQGLTEFLPVSSSGHIEIGSYLLGANSEENLLFTVIVHGATALSTVVVFRKDIVNLVSDLFKFEWNESTKYVLMIVITMIPVGIVGVLWEDQLAELFGGNIVFVACMLLITGTLLMITYFTPEKTGELSYFKAFIIGIAQAIAVLPGISRSGATITTGLYLGIEKTRATRFSFLIVLPPILGAMILTILKLSSAESTGNTDVAVFPLICGFLAAFISGILACQWMINIVRKGKLIYFAYYCYAIAIITLLMVYLT